MSKFLSVVIPTYNRKEKLEMVLDSLNKQTYPKNKFEVLVIDDGSKDGTEKMLDTFKPSFDLKYFKSRKKGANAARNLGIKKARGEIVFFTGDDIILDKNLLKEHMKYHIKFEEIVIVGRTLPWPEFVETPFRKFNKERSLIHYKKLKNQKNDLKGAHCFSAGNASLPRKIFLAVGLFDEDLAKYGWQDIEFGYRLEKKKIKRMFNENAIAYHYHYLDLKMYCARLKQIGQGAVIVWQKHPALKIFLGIHFLNFAIDALFFPCGKGIKLGEKIITLAEKHNFGFLLKILYNLLFNHYYLIGVREGRKKI